MSITLSIPDRPIRDTSIMLLFAKFLEKKVLEKLVYPFVTCCCYLCFVIQS